MRKVNEEKEVQAKILEWYMEPVFLAPPELQKYTESQVTKWGTFIKKLGIVLKQ